MDQLQRFIDLANKTGDNLVIFDRYNPDKSFVILAINKYEDLLETKVGGQGLTDDEVADKINSDIAIWKNEQLLVDASDNDFHWLEEEDEYDDEELLDEEEEELNYFYSEPEISFTPDSSQVSEELVLPQVNLENEVVESSEPVVPEPAIEETKAESETEQVAKADFQSLADILDTRFDRSKANNWSIPSDRKRQAEGDDINKYETISF